MERILTRKICENTSFLCSFLFTFCHSFKLIFYSLNSFSGARLFLIGSFCLKKTKNFVIGS